MQLCQELMPPPHRQYPFDYLLDVKLVRILAFLRLIFNPLIVCIATIKADITSSNLIAPQGRDIGLVFYPPTDTWGCPWFKLIAVGACCSSTGISVEVASRGKGAS